MKDLQRTDSAFWLESFPSLKSGSLCTLRKELWNPLLLQGHMAFVYLQSNIVYKASANKIKTLALQAHSDIRKASGFVITTEPLGFVLTKEVNVFLLRVWAFHLWSTATL